ncbi:MAG: molybdopterin dinucleotide binding domain-containing protein, partial [Sarcina sp.]
MTNPYIIYNERAIEPKHKLMDEYYFFMELAMELAIENYPYVPKKEYLEKVIEPLKSFDKYISLDKLKDSYFTIHKPIAWEDKQFKTPSGKFELYSERAKNEGISPIPIYFRDEFNKEKYALKSMNDNKKYAIDNSNSKYRFRLLTNHSRDSLFSQHFMDKEGMAQAYINDKEALSLNLENKEKVVLQSKNGCIEVEINIDNSVCDEVVKMYVGWWKKQGNPNFLTYNGCSDMGGQITYNETMVNIIK